MPHIAITMYPGRGEEAKQSLAKRMQQTIIDELKVPSCYVSVSIEEISPDKWEENLAQFADHIYVKAE